MLKDRDNKKWQGLMLPEHVKMLKEVFEEVDHKERPILDEQQQMENSALLQSALHNDSAVEIKYFANHDFHYISGRILFIDVLGDSLHLEEGRIKLSDVVEVII